MERGAKNQEDQPFTVTGERGLPPLCDITKGRYPESLSLKARKIRNHFSHLRVDLTIKTCSVSVCPACDVISAEFIPKNEKQMLRAKASKG